MNCHQVHDYWEAHSQPGSTPAIAGELLQHISRCPECAGFVEEQEKLGTQLRLVRDAAPEMSASLDAAVLASYRNYIGSHESGAAFGVRPSRIRSVAIFALAAAAVAIAVVVAYPQIHLFLPASRVSIPAPQMSPAPPVTVSAQNTVPGKAQSLGATSKLKKSPHSGVRARAVSAALSPMAPAFQGLMYCDELSCSGAMQVIRVELPAPALASGAPAKPGEAVFADVLVGSDGIARGIRIVQ
jgi:hypothetical protein